MLVFFYISRVFSPLAGVCWWVNIYVMPKGFSRNDDAKLDKTIEKMKKTEG